MPCRINAEALTSINLKKLLYGSLNMPVATLRPCGGYSHEKIDFVSWFDGGYYYDTRSTAGGTAEQRMVGTWTNVVGGSSLVLNADGTTSGWGWSHWAAVDSKLVMAHATGSRAYEFRSSSDARTLIISSPRQGDLGTNAWIFRRN